MDPEPKKEQIPKAPDFLKVFDMLLKECSEKNACTEATFGKMYAFVKLENRKWLPILMIRLF